jgi:DNA-binding response OmpR family regulator
MSPTPLGADLKAAPWLIVEDESVIGMLIEDALAELGLATLGPITRVEKALPLARERPLAGAVLDVNLAGTVVYPVAEALLARRIPFLFVTGYGEAGRPPHLTHARVLAKPFMVEDLHRAVLALRERGG